MGDKRQSRLRRARKARAKMRDLGAVRLTVYKTNKHLYAQIIESSPTGDKILASVSTGSAAEASKNLQGAAFIGSSIAEKAKEKGVEKVAFDRSGYPYHGRIRQIAESAREAGLQF